MVYGLMVHSVDSCQTLYFSVFYTPEGNDAQKKTRQQMLRTRLTIESNSLGQQNLIGYLVANLKPKLPEERASQIHIPSWKLHFVSHLCS